MEQTDAIAHFVSAIQNLPGCLCWAFAGGEGTGSTFSIEIGKKIARNKPLKNRFLSEDAKLYDGEYSLYVQFASWRLDDAQQVICTSTDSNHNEGVMVQGLSKLVGCVVSKALLTKPGYDLVLDFDRGYRLTVFCCWSNELEPATNYDFFTPHQVFSVESRSEIAMEPRNLTP